MPVETNIALPHSDDWDDGHLTVTDIDPATGLLTTSTEGNPPLDEGTSIYDLYADPMEKQNVAARPEYAQVREQMASSLLEWMQQTEDPLLSGAVEAPVGARVNRRDDYCAEDLAVDTEE